MDISVADMAQRLGYAERTIRDMIVKKEIKAWRVRRKWFIPEGEIKRLQGDAAETEQQLTSFPQAPPTDKGIHWNDLMPVLLDLQGVEPLPVDSEDLATWHFRPKEPSWPITRGRVCRHKNGTLGIQLPVEQKLEWAYLRQHLSDDPVWDAIEAWKQAMAEDLGARMAILRGITPLIEKPEAQGGLGLSVVPDIMKRSENEAAVDLYYVFTIYRQVLAQSLGLSLVAKRKEEFLSEAPDTVHLGGRPVIAAPNAALRGQAVDFLLQAQDKFVSIEEAQTAKVCYREGEQRTDELKRHLDRLRLARAFPAGTLCDGCRGWASSN